MHLCKISANFSHIIAKEATGGTTASVGLFSSGIKKALVLIKMYITYHPDKNGPSKNYVTFCKDLNYVNLKEDRRKGQDRIRKYEKKIAVSYILPGSRWYY